MSLILQWTQIKWLSHDSNVLGRNSHSSPNFALKPSFNYLKISDNIPIHAQIYNNWRGHDSDALAVYDNITRMYPEDYRGYLAKGMFMKEKGRKADADRMFLQAR